MLCTVGSKGSLSAEFLTCHKFWLANSGSCTAEAEPQADSQMFSTFFSLTNGMSENNMATSYKLVAYEQSLANPSYPVNNSESS